MPRWWRAWRELAAGLLRRRVQRAVDRRFNRARYDAAQTIAAFADQLKEAVDLEAVQADLANVVYQVLEPTQVWVWTGHPDQAFRSSVRTAVEDPPIGTEPMTYALRECPRALLAVQSLPKLHVRRLLLVAIVGC